MSGASFVLVRSQQECPPVKNPAGNDAHRYTAAIFLRFEAYGICRKRITRRQLDIESARIQSHAGLLLIEGAQPLDPESETGDAADHPASQARHILRNNRL